MNKHRKDSDALLEAFNQVQLSEQDYDGDGKKESPEEEYKGSVDKAIKKAKGEEEVKEEKTSADQDKTPYDGHEDQEDDVQEEGRVSMPDDDIFEAGERIRAGDWKTGINLVTNAIGKHMIADIEQSGNSPLDDADTADVWNIKDGIKLAIEDLLGGANAAEYEDLTKDLRRAFHKSQSKSEDLSQFFDGEPPLHA